MDRIRSYYRLAALWRLEDWAAGMYELEPNWSIEDIQGYGH